MTFSLRRQRCRLSEEACSLLRALACVRRSHTGRLRRVFPEAHVPGKNDFNCFFALRREKLCEACAEQRNG